MGFMVPVAEYFRKSDCIDKLLDGTFKCDECNQDHNVFNITISGDNVYRCIECAPPEPGWYGRLSASGYLDCTSWTGPFPTADEALTYVQELFECDENGDDSVDNEEE